MDVQADLGLCCLLMPEDIFAWSGPIDLILSDYLFKVVILSLPLIQEGLLSVSGERMCTILVNRLED